jgi:beta-fructofuranosidase
MTWGHAISNDPIHWQDKPFALYPDQDYDMESAFDGTILKNGYQNKTTLVYTGVSQLPLHWTLNYNLM